MTSIAEDPSLPLDLDGTSNQLSNSGPLDSTSYDVTSSISSELEQPGTFRNLTSAGRMSPHRTRTMKDQESQLAELRKDNFGLKLRIYHLEEALRNRWGDDNEGWKLNIELQVQLDNFKRELAEKDALLVQAKSAIDSMAAQHEAHIRQMQQRAAKAVQTEEFEALKERLEDKEAELADTLREAEEANARMEEVQGLNDRLGQELQEKDDHLGQMERELDDLQRALAEKDAAEKVTPLRRPTRNISVQTVEPLVGMLDSAQAELEVTQARLRDKDRAVVELQSALGEKERRIKELEVELLVSSQQLAAGAGEHASQMQDQAAQLDQCRANLRDAEAQLKDRGAELEDQGRQLEDTQRRLQEADALVRQLQPAVEQRDREIENLSQRLSDAEAQASENEQAKDRKIQDLGRKLRDAEAQARQSQPELAAKNREIEDLNRSLWEKDEEIARLQSRLREKEDALSHARKSTHTANMDRQEQSSALERLQKEIAALRDQLRQQHTNAQHDLEAALAAKDAILKQLRRELLDLQRRLSGANEKLLELTTTKAAEIGVLHGTIEDLSRQLEHQEELVRALKREIGELTGQKASLERELGKLRAANQGLHQQLEELQGELATAARKLEQAEQTIAHLQRIIEDLQRSQPKQSELEKMAAELSRLRSQVASLEHALRNKDAEVESLMQTLKLKDGTIREVQQQLQRLANEKAQLEERVRELEAEKIELENEIAQLESQARVSKLSSDDLQHKLTQVYGEREELARKLKLAEEMLAEKGVAYEQVKAACEALQEQIKRLQEQVAELSKQPKVVSVGVSTGSPPKASAQPQQPGPSSTTMIFGSMSENLLLTILQRLQELYSETTAGRADSKHASSSMSSKLEHITELQRQLEAAVHDRQPQESKPASANTSYTAYYFMRGEEEGSEGEQSPRRSSTPKSGKPSPARTPQKTPDLSTALRDAMRQIGALQSELEDVRRWNASLQARLDETGRSRDVGVGMEKDGEPQASVTAQPPDFAPERYLELEKEVDRLLSELEAERERSQAEKEEQQEEFAALQDKLQEAEERVVELERQLRSAMRVEAATSTTDLTIEMLQQEVDRLRQELDKARGTIAGLRGRIEAESDDNQRLRAELAEVQGTSLKGSPHTQDKSTLASSSLPNLLTPDRTPGRVMADSWTSPGHVRRGDQLEVRALREKHEEVTRLNQELQRKCVEQLKRSPPHSRPPSGSHSAAHWQTRLREQEQTLRSEMLERERSLLTQLRESEARNIEREGEWKTRETTLKKQVVSLESRLGESQRSCEDLRSRLAEALADNRDKDEEIENLTRSLEKAREKIRALEEQIDHLLAEKNASIRDLESKVRHLEHELQLSRERVQRLSHTLELLEGVRGEGGRAVEGEMRTLQETVDSLTQQLTSSFEELEDLRRQNLGLEEERTVLTSHLDGCQEQIRTLQDELNLYQKLLEDAARGQSGKSTQAGESTGLSLTAEKILQLLEEIRRLREQLDQSIRSNSALAAQLRSRLDETTHRGSTSTNTHVHFTRSSPGVKTRSSQTRWSTADRGTSPARVHVTEKFTSTRTPATERGTNTLHMPSAEHARATSTTTRTERTSTRYHHDSRTDRGTSPLHSQSFPDINLSDSSTSSFTHRSSTSRPKPGEAVSLSTTNITFTSPKDTSTPYVGEGGGGTSTSTSRDQFSSSRVSDTTAQRRQFSDGLHSDRVTRVTHVTRGMNTDVPRRSHPSDVTPKGPSLDSSTSSFHSHTSTTRSSHGVPPPGDSTSPRHWRRPGGSGSLGATASVPHPPPPLSSFLHGAGDFEALETRLKQALDSPSLQGADRVFLEELLLYLRQQRRQLDESRRLLERLERQQEQQTDIPASSHIGAESGTLPRPASGHTTPTPSSRPTGQSSADGAAARGSRVDLSSLYEQLLQTHASLVEAKSSLTSQQRTH